jgi:hypothetical protein
MRSFNSWCAYRVHEYAEMAHDAIAAGSCTSIILDCLRLERLALEYHLLRAEQTAQFSDKAPNYRTDAESGRLTQT